MEVEVQILETNIFSRIANYYYIKKKRHIHTIYDLLLAKYKMKLKNTEIPHLLYLIIIFFPNKVVNINY